MSAVEKATQLSERDLTAPPYIKGNAGSTKEFLIPNIT